VIAGVSQLSSYSNYLYHAVARLGSLPEVCHHPCTEPQVKRPDIHSNRNTVGGLSETADCVVRNLVCATKRERGKQSTIRRTSISYSSDKFILVMTSRLTGQGGLSVPCQQVYDRRANTYMLLLVFVTLSHSTHTSPPPVLVATLINDLYFSLITFFLLLVPSQDH
jgi:hypothetical protein